VLLSESSSIAKQSGTTTATLTNKDVVGLVQVGLSPEIIIAKIGSSRCEFDTSPDSLKALKTANVPDSVILAMVKSPSVASASTKSPEVEPVIRTAKVACLSVSEVPLLREPASSHLVKQLACGSEIAVLTEQGEYLKVRTLDGATGYLHEVFVTKSTPQAVSVPSLRNSGPPAPPSNMIRAIAWRAVPWVTTSYYQTPGNASTECTGSGSWTGSIWQGNSSCSTQYTPAQTVPVNWQHVTIYNLVETGNTRMIIACTRNWAFSKCSYLVPGDNFHYETRNGKVEVAAHQGGKNKEVTLSFDVVSSQAK
jgi:hypothetical protein